MLTDNLVHLCRRIVLKSAPPEVFIIPTPLILALGIESTLDWCRQPVRLVLLKLLKLVEPPQKEQIRDLLHDFKRIGDSSRPE